ncbi:MAG: hypothetical protein ACQES5_05960 [Thermodesulfobacteriota bacterium]
MADISESDWKKIRSMEKDKLDTLCESVLTKIRAIIDDDTKGPHERYLDLWKVIKHKDKVIAKLFNDFKRSNATTKLIHWVNEDLLSEEEFESFSQETQKRLKFLCQLKP